MNLRALSLVLVFITLYYVISYQVRGISDTALLAIALDNIFTIVACAVSSVILALFCRHMSTSELNVYREIVFSYLLIMGPSQSWQSFMWSYMMIVVISIVDSLK